MPDSEPKDTKVRPGRDLTGRIDNYDAQTNIYGDYTPVIEVGRRDGETDEAYLARLARQVDERR
jgi:small nuclear ribonucleoprotein (snRNP)-like protein